MNANNCPHPNICAYELRCFGDCKRVDPPPYDPRITTHIIHPMQRTTQQMIDDHRAWRRRTDEKSKTRPWIDGGNYGI